jgi:drug/metabolite transporter (DMT)-like permease
MESHANSPPGRRPGPILTNILVAVLCLIWGSTWLVIKVGLNDLPAFTSAAIRFALATLFMGLLARKAGRVEGGAAPSIRLSLVMGLSNFSLSYALVYQCERYLPSSLASVLWATYPLLLALLGHWFLPGERLQRRQWLGFVAGFMGVAVLMQVDVRGLGREAFLAGLLLLLSPLIVAAGTVVIKRRCEHVSSLLLNRNGMFVGTILLSVFAFVFERKDPVRITGRAIGSVGYLAVVGSVTAFGLYFWLLRFAPAMKLALIAYVTPVVALFLGFVFGDEPIGLATLGGAALVALGIGLARRRSDSRSHAATAPTSALPVTGRRD